MRYQATDTQTGEVLYESNLPPSMWSRPRRTAYTRRQPARRYTTQLDSDLLLVAALMVGVMAMITMVLR